MLFTSKLSLIKFISETASYTVLYLPVFRNGKIVTT